MRAWKPLTLFGAIALATTATANMDPAATSITELKKLSVEELLDLQITSVSRSREQLSEAPAAIAVVTNEDIRRSGSTNVPEALRFVPGLHVAQRNASSWAVSARGFSSVNSEKLLVLSDTRSIYTPLFSGVFWDVQDYLVADIERIEVIRGPGATLWGSNAVNGVISITTRAAKDTQGAYLEAAAGSESRANVAARLGTTLGENAYIRVFGKYAEHDDSHHPQTANTDDGRLAHGGFRADWELGLADTLTVQGDVYRGEIGQLAPSITVIGREGPTGPLRVELEGGNVLARWQRRIDDHAELQLRAYYDLTRRNDPSYDDELQTVDVDFQHRLAIGTRHSVTWGLAYRSSDNTNQGKGIFALSPADATDAIASGFIQDQFRLTDSLLVTFGTKLEHNDFSGTEWQPSVRAAWSVAASHTLWAAISRAVRVPTRVERDILVDAGDPAGNPRLLLMGDDDFDSEELLAYELGYRWKATASLSLDLATFYNDYDGLASLEIGTPFIDPDDGRTIVPVVYQNRNSGHTRGIEALLTFTPTPYWRLSANYAYIDMDLEAAGLDLNRGVWLEDATPRQTAGLRSFLDLPGGFQIDAQLRYVSEIERLPDVPSGEGIPAYTELDLRIAWRGWREMELSLVGQNLLHDHHLEFGTPATRGEIERAVYGKFAWGF
jgi:iron complex outermembrane receptor protein